MKEVLIKEYNNLKYLKTQPLFPQPTFTYSFVQGARLEVQGKTSKKYKVQFINQENNKTIHEAELTNNMWTKTSVEYFVNYNIKVIDLDDGEVAFTHKFNAKDKKVYIHISSAALGDTLAWFPYAEKFRKKHQCELIVSTFHNEMFEENYPEITFSKPGEVQYDLYAMYEIGWHYKDGKVDNTKNPSDFKTINLQESCTEALGIEYVEIKPKLTYKNTGPTVEGKYVVIAPHGSAHAKYWNTPGG